MVKRLCLSASLADAYVVGLPMLAVVTLHNVSEETTYQHLGEPDLLDDALGLELMTEDGAALVSAGHGHGEGAPVGRMLEPGERWSFTVDLSAGWTPTVGARSVRLQWPGLQDVRSEPLRLYVVEAPGAVRASADRVSAGQPWAWWVLDEGAATDPEDERALEGSAIELLGFVRRATHGTLGLAELDIELLGQIGGPAEMESALLRHEVLVARSDPMTGGLGGAIAERWPGCGARLDENAAGFGWLAQLRATHRVPPDA